MVKTVRKCLQGVLGTRLSNWTFFIAYSVNLIVKYKSVHHCVNIRVGMFTILFLKTKYVLWLHNNN